MAKKAALIIEKPKGEYEVKTPSEPRSKKVNSFKAPDTTQEQQANTAGQRVVNLMWETTQSQIARFTVYSGIAINSIVIMALIILRQEISTVLLTVILGCLASMNTTTGMVIGFYFSRTNHTAIGGTGQKPQQSSIGTR